MVDTKTLGLTLRPQRLSDVIGYDDTVSQIRNQLKSGRLPTAWLFGGELGSGKTTLARIIAISLQCTHGVPGDPCNECLNEWWDITEVNASELNGVNEMKALVERAGFMPTNGNKKVFILDEAHRVTDPAQNLLLKYFEDAHDHVVWIICTTEPNKILPALRSRCLSFTVQGLDDAGLEKLVSLALKHVKSKATVDELVKALKANQVRSPRLILGAVEKYLAGAAPDMAALVAEPTTADVLGICRATIKGSWAEVAKLLQKASPSDGRAIRVAVASYFRSVMIKSASTRAAVCADAIQELTKISVFEDGLQLSVTAAALFKVCQIIRGTSDQGRSASSGANQDS